MKKIIALLVLFSLSLTLFGCGKTDDEKDSTGKTPEASSSQTQGSTDNKSETKPVSRPKTRMVYRQARRRTFTELPTFDRKW